MNNRSDSNHHMSLEEIARVAGVSLSTAYRVLRGNVKTRHPRHDQLRMLLANAGYLASHYALNGPVLLVTSLLQTSHGFSLLNLTRELCESAGIETIIVLDNTIESELRRRRVGGVITLEPVVIPADIPAVYLNLRDPSGTHVSICTDTFVSMLDLLRYLTKLHCRRIGIFYPQRVNTALEYWKCGVWDAELLYSMAGLPYDPNLIQRDVIDTTTHFEVCSKAAKHFARLPDPPDAIVASGDLYLLTMADEWRNDGFSGLNKIIMAAGDDTLRWPLSPSNNVPTDHLTWERFGHICNRRLLRMRFPLQEMAHTAVDSLRRQYREPDSCARTLILHMQIDDNLKKDSKS